MSVLFILIPISVALSILFVTLCWLSIKQGQFDDLDSPAWRILFDDGVIPQPSTPVRKNS